MRDARGVIQELSPLFQPGVATSCNTIPITCFARGQDSNGNKNVAPHKSLIPAAQQTDAIRFQHKHLAKSDIQLNEEAWFSIEDEGDHLFDDGLKHSILTNNNECRPFKCFTVAVVDFRSLPKLPQSSMSPKCAGFWKTKQHVPIVSVFFVQCGKMGRIFEPSASISLVRANRNMDDKITNKKWTMEQLENDIL